MEAPAPEKEHAATALSRAVPIMWMPCAVVMGVVHLAPSAAAVFVAKTPRHVTVQATAWNRHPHPILMAAATMLMTATGMEHLCSVL